MTTETEPQKPEPAPTPAAKKSRLEVAREKAAQATARLQKLEALARTREASQGRKLDTRRKVLLGAYLLTRIQKDDELELKAQVLADLNKYLTRDAERALFDLPLLPKPEPVPATAGEAFQGQAAATPQKPAPTAPTQTNGV